MKTRPAAFIGHIMRKALKQLIDTEKKTRRKTGQQGTERTSDGQCSGMDRSVRKQSLYFRHPNIEQCGRKLSQNP